MSGLNAASAQAMLVDFGSTINCQFKTDVFAPVHMELPTFAYHCMLYGADERPAPAIVNMLRQYDSSVPVSAFVRSKKTPSLHCVELTDTRKGRDVKLSDLLLVTTSAIVPPPADISADSVEYVYVTSVMADSEFFGQLAKYDADTLDQFRRRLNDFYRVNSVVTVAGARPGDFCCCQYAVDSLYYRARVLKKYAATQYVVSTSVILCDAV